MNSWPIDLKHKKIYMVGIKGTGMTALAELLTSRGAIVSGSDVADVFYTDEILASIGIAVHQGFSADNVPDNVDFVVHSAAYDPQMHPELLEAVSLGLPIMEYTVALGAFSHGLDSSGVAGVHGKTTTTAMIGTLVKALALPGSILVGSGVSNFDGRSTLTLGHDFFVAETCEYRRHFLHFHPRRIILTSVETDHQDYFKDYNDIANAFVEYALRLPKGGRLIYCADDAGASEVAGRVADQRTDVRLVPYGFGALGPWRIIDSEEVHEAQIFSIKGINETFGQEHHFTLRVPGRHNVLNATAALAMLAAIHEDHYGALTATHIDLLSGALEGFRGSKRRGEIVGTAREVLFLDDYAHHPTAIRTTLEGFKDFYPDRRLVVDFMSHTYSRTAALLDDFAASFGAADEVILHDIYASARESYDGTVTGALLYERTRNQHPLVTFFPKPVDAQQYLRTSLSSGDLFVTMGAGDNWKLGRALFEEFSGTPV